MRNNIRLIDLKNKRGITIASLLITVIIIIILLTVTTKMLTGKNGLIKETQTAKIEIQIENIERLINRSYQYLQEETDNAFEEAVKELKKEGYKIKTVIQEDGISKSYYVLIDDNYYKLMLENDEIKVDITY